MNGALNFPNGMMGLALSRRRISNLTTHCEEADSLSRISKLYK